MQSRRKAKIVIWSQSEPKFYKVEQPGCERQAQATATAGHTIHVTGESIVLPNKKDSKLQPP